MTIRGVVFDATGTLFETREPVGATYARAAAEIGVKLPAWRLDDAFKRVMSHGPSLARVAAAGATRAQREAAEIDWWIDRVRQTFQATDSTVQLPDAKAFGRALFERYRAGSAWRERPGARALLESLQRAGLALGVASQFDHRLPEILEALDLAGFFETVEIPSRAGRAKPERAVFEALAAALGCALGELAYVGDDPPEVLAAIAGLGVAVFDVRADPDFSALAERLCAEAGGGAAKLRVNSDASGETA